GALRWCADLPVARPPVDAPRIPPDARKRLRIERRMRALYALNERPDTRATDATRDRHGFIEKTLAR
ncbi:MAG: hypothetical protein V4793_43565, partial [Paraburkholderia tropica]